MIPKHLYSSTQNTEARAPKNELEAALEQVLYELRAGLIHGFFDFTMSCEIVGGAKRRFTLRAGKSHRFVIPEEALD